MFVVIEKWGEPIICQNYNGETEKFETRKEAQLFADEWCQDGQVVELD